MPRANRDSELAENPDTLDLTRTSPRHVAFGHGVYHCIFSAVLGLHSLRITW